MNVQSRPWPAAVALALGLTLSGCAIDAPASGDAPSSADRKKDRKKDRKNERHTDRKQKAAAPRPQPKPPPKTPPTQVWVCSWSPTYDDDWHNDVLCDNGIASERPRLREGDDFVEQAEMMESAKEYARQRNAG